MIVTGHATCGDESISTIDLCDLANASFSLAFERRLDGILPKHYFLGLEHQLPAFCTIGRYVRPATHQTEREMLAIFGQINHLLRQLEFNRVLGFWPKTALGGLITYNIHRHAQRVRNCRSRGAGGGI